MFDLRVHSFAMVAETGANGRTLVARNLRRLRVAGRRSLSELARDSGVGKATLSAIERGANPTVETLAAVAAGLGVPVAALLEEPAHDELEVHRAADGRIDLAVRPIARAGAVEIAEATLAPHATEERRPGARGARMHVLVTAGSLVTGPAGRVTELGPGDLAAFPADGPHALQAGAEGAAAVLVTVAHTMD